MAGVQRHPFNETTAMGRGGAVTRDHGRGRAPARASHGGRVAAGQPRAVAHHDRGQAHGRGRGHAPRQQVPSHEHRHDYGGQRYATFSDESKDDGKRSGHSGFKKMTVVRGVSIADEMNAKFRASMEDTHIADDHLGASKTSALFAVFDGHGGREVAEYLKMHLPPNIAREVGSKQHKSVEEALAAAFLVTDIKAQATLKDSAAGSTAVCVLIRMVGKTRYAFTANCGDARAVLCVNGGAERLSLDHKASDAAEIMRIEKAGGFVLRKRVLGVLAVARSFGDFALKKFVPCTPYTSTRKLDVTCQFIVIACDGIWDVLSDAEAVTLVREFCGGSSGSTSKAARAAQYLIDTAIARGTTDNVTAMVVFL